MALPTGFTFDIGNWRWTGTDPVAAMAALAPYVTYVHTKAVAAAQDGGRPAAVPLDAAPDAPWRALVDAFPRDLPRAIEFPLAGEDLLAVTRYYVALLAAA